MLAALKKYFQHGTAEREVDFLASVFNEPHEYVKAISPANRSISILVASKGVGKSALIYYLSIKARLSNLPVLVLTPTDIITQDLACASSHVLFKKILYNDILLAISYRLTEYYPNLITEEQSRILQSAIDAGKAKPDFVSKLTKFLIPIGVAVSGVNFKELIPNSDKISNEKLINIIKSNLSSNKSIFYLCIDDTDQIANAGDDDYLDKIWFTILAVGDIAKNFPNIKCMITLRQEIWDRIQNDGQSKRDQIDHYRSMVVSMSTDDASLKSILNARLRQSMRDQMRGEDNAYKVFFESDTVTIPSSSEQRWWPDFLVKNSRSRPRDIIQLMNALIESAESDSRHTISQIDVERINLKYSEERKNDLANENVHSCESLSEIIRMFKKINFEFTGSTLFNFLKTFEGAGFPIKIYSKTIKFYNEEDIVYFWDYLRKTGFIAPRVKDNSQEKGYKHLAVYEDSDLVSIRRKSEILNMTWDVHPVFRSYLLSLKNELKNRSLTNYAFRDKKVKGTTIKKSKKKY